MESLHNFQMSLPQTGKTGSNAQRNRQDRSTRTHLHGRTAR